MNSLKMTLISLTTLASLALAGCVSKSTFQTLADQAKKTDADLTQLQGRHQELQEQQAILQQEKMALANDKATLLTEKAGLQNAGETLQQEKAALQNERDSLARAKDTLTAGNRELEEILAAREDALTKKIAELRQELAGQVVNTNNRLAAQSRQIAQLRGCEDKFSEQTGKLTECVQRSGEQATLLAAASAANAQLNDELRQLRAEKEIAVQQMDSTYQALIGKMKSEIDNGQITISELKGKLTVNLIDAILFDSGRAEIKAQGLQVLQKVIDILKEVSGKSIRIEGHTDNVPISSGLAQKYPSNWELAAARAVNVAKFLQDRGIDPHSLNAVAHGEYKPVATNDTEAGRAMNRRIEIVLTSQE